MRLRITVASLLALLSATAGASRRPDDFTILLYCPWEQACSMQFFLTDEVTVVASTGRLDVYWNGGWGARDGCSECEINWPQYEAPAPEPATPDPPSDCPDQAQNDLRNEYITDTIVHGQLLPSCSDIRTGSGTQNFSWGELANHDANSDHYPWGIVDSSLFSALEATRTGYDDQPIAISSGYRCPKGNREANGVSLSRHMVGMAADMYGSGVTWNEAAFDSLKSAANGNFDVLLNWTTYLNHHLHGQLNL